MLVCPQCQFENPNPNKFCQRCGTSLTQKHCPECATLVSFDQLDCHNCGTLTGTVWLAVVSPVAKLREPLQDDHLVGANTSVEPANPSPFDQIGTEQLVTTPVFSSDPPEFISTSGAATPVEDIFAPNDLESITVPAQDVLTEEQPPPETFLSNKTLDLQKLFLDAQHRYQLLESLPTLLENQTLTVKVLDTQPLQISPVQALQKTTVPTPIGQVDPFVIPIAQAYLNLNSEYSPYFPTLQDAWEDQNYRVILLEDYSNFPLLADSWSERATTPQQIVNWLRELTELWVILERWHCRQSILDLLNLKVFPNNPQQLCVQRLYFDAPDSSLNLSNLGQLWQELFQHSQRTLVGSLTEILRDLIEEQIQSVDELRTALTGVLDEINHPSAFKPSCTGMVQPSINPIQPLIHLEAWGQTDVGLQRDHNEDCFGIETEIKIRQTPTGQQMHSQGLYILCDGMGGHAGGEIASQMAVDTLKQYFQEQWDGELPSEDTLNYSILKANQAIFEENQQGVRSGSGRMGTTLVMAVVVNHQVAVAHVGDSRLYRLTRQQGLQQITIDHEVGQREIQRGVSPELAYSRPDAYQLIQALGPRDEQYVRPDLQFFEIHEDTVLILASDGLTDNDLLESFCETHVNPLLNRQTPLTTGVNNLIQLANQYNGHDNITAIVIRAFPVTS